MTVSDLAGKTISTAEHLKGESDDDEAIRLTMTDGTVLEVGTSEWLHVTIKDGEGR